MKKISVVVPCYNEAENIPLIVEKFTTAFAGKKEVEVLLVNNGSTDHSAQVLNETLKDLDDLFTVVHVPENQGYGYGILSGLEEASGEILGWTHADLQTDPSDVAKAYDLYDFNLNSPLDQEILVKGKRKERRFFESLLTLGMQLFSYFVLKVYIDDINAQPKLFSRRFFENEILGKAPFDFSLDLFLLLKAKKNNVRILEIPVHFGKRLYGEAKGGGSWKTRIKVIKRTIAFIFELKKSGW